MRLTVLALDYDGTIARNNVLEPEVLTAIADARERGIIVLIVTGRILDDLRRVAGDLGFVDAVVAENGAVVAFPETGRSMTLAAPVPSLLVDDLRRRGLSIEVGHCVMRLTLKRPPSSSTPFMAWRCRTC
jgi:hydroxymethylpyrimidine pyrophosphatase-like HAD family hydrolase